MNTETNTVKLPSWVLWSLIIVSFIGFLDATYLTVSHYTGSALNCTLLKGCDVVTTSKYSEIFNIPVALLGMLFYFTMLVLSLLYLDTKHRTILKFIPILGFMGFLASIWFVYSQVVLIEALCQYCMLSAITSTILFILSLYVSKYRKDRSCGL